MVLLLALWQATLRFVMQVEELQLAVVEKQQQVDQLQLYINKLEDKQDLLQGKLADARARCA